MLDPRDGKSAAGAELVLPALAVAFTLYFFYSVDDLVWEAKATAMVVGGVLLALIAIFLARVGLRLWKGEAGFSIEPLLAPRRLMLPRLLVVGICALFIVLIPWLGLTLGLFLLAAALMVVLRAGSWRLIAATAASIAIAAYLLFIALLNSRLPRGPVEKLIAGLF